MYVQSIAMPTFAIPTYDPVVCGGACEYSNLCVAANADFTSAECESGTLPSPPEEPPPMCPKPDLTGDGCPEIFNQDSCADCVYKNICFAEAASFLETDCEPAKIGTEDDQKESCPWRVAWYLALQFLLPSCVAELAGTPACARLEWLGIKD
jgi:hypothetical protein